MKKMMKKALLLMLVLAMVIPSNVQAASVNQYRLVETNISNSLRSEKLDESLMDLSDTEGEKVRVVVELSSEPIIDLATLQGVEVEDLPDDVVEDQAMLILGEQEAVLEDLQVVEGEVEVHNRYINVMNGFSVTIDAQQLNRLLINPLVTKVSASNVYERPEPMMVNSGIITQAKVASVDTGYDGEGMVVAIIDTGIDFTHKDMRVDEGTNVALTAEGIATLVTEEALPGHYYSEKVPYGYNYMDLDEEIRDVAAGASMHGMHVSGTVAANGEDILDEEGNVVGTDGIDGVAPNAQLLAMKVFGNDPDFQSTFGDVIIAAIDDAIALGADVMNLSLGSTAAFVDDEDPEQVAVARAVENGIVMSISAGNSASFGAGAYDDNMVFGTNPDVGVVGSPGLATESMQVASVNNILNLYVTGIFLDNDVLPGFGKDAWNMENVEIVPIGGDKLGYPSDYEGIDVYGKVVLVSRGALSFRDKTMYAAQAGAIGIICYDHGLAQFYYNQGGWEVPFMMISLEDGLALESLLEESASINADLISVDEYADSTSGKMSDFSSYGTTPSLDFKPEITAPGGNIYSTLNNDSYGFMSGTSMAAPHAAGGAALVLERIASDEDVFFGKVEEGSASEANLAKNILMNTAVPVLADTTSYRALMAQLNGFTIGYASPRLQGAGSMQLESALHTSVVVTGEEGIGKVNLREVSGNVLSFTLDLKNYGDEAMTYDLNTVIQAEIPTYDYIDVDEDGNSLSEQVMIYNTLVPIVLDGQVDYVVHSGELETGSDIIPAAVAELIAVEDPSEEVTFITVNPNSTASVDVTIALDPTIYMDLMASYPNGFFIEGFVELNDGEATMMDINQKISLATDEILDEILMNENILAGLEAAYEELLDLSFEEDEAEVAALYEAMISAEAAAQEALAKVEAVAEQEETIDQLEAMLEQLQYEYSVLVGEAVSVEVVQDLIEQINQRITMLQARIDVLALEEGNDETIARINQRIADLEARIDALPVTEEDLALFDEVLERYRVAIEDMLAEIEAAQAVLATLIENVSDEDDQLIADWQEAVTAYNLAAAELEQKIQDHQLLLSNKLAEIEALAAYIDSVYDALFELQDITDRLRIMSFALTELSVPYIAFMGDWGAADAFDVSLYDDFTTISRATEAETLRAGKEEAYSFYGLTGLLDEYYDFLGYDMWVDEYMSEHTGFSPNGDDYNEALIPIFSLLRNITDVSFDIIDDEGQLVIGLGSLPSMRKHYYDSGYGDYYFLDPEYGWDGTVNGEIVEEGHYHYVVSGLLADGTPKSLDMPFYLDMTAPILEEVTVDRESGQLVAEASDDGTGIAYYFLINEITGDVIDYNNTGEFDVRPYLNSETCFSIYLEDYVGNGAYMPNAMIIDVINPDIRISVDAFDVIGTRELETSGVVYEMLAPQLTINGNEVATVGVAGEHTFDYAETFEADGKHSLRIEAVDVTGNHSEYTKWFYIDSQAPVISSNNGELTAAGAEELNVNYVTESNFHVDVDVTDNFPDMVVKVNGSEVYTSSVDYVSYDELFLPASYHYEDDLELQPGLNTISFFAKDYPEHTTRQDLHIYLLGEGEPNPDKAVVDVRILQEDITMTIGDDLVLEVEYELADGTVLTTVDNAIADSTSDRVIVAKREAGFELTAVAVGNDVVTVSVNGQSDTVNVTVRPVTTPTRPATTVTPTPAPTDTVIEEEATPQASPEFILEAYVDGYPDGTFLPDGNITRAEITKMFVTVLLNLNDGFADGFDDTANHWAVEYIEKIQLAGLIDGYEDGTFLPDNNIKRGEMAKILAMVIEMLELEVPEADVTYTDINTWAKSYIETITAYGIVLNEEATEFLPEQYLTRAEAVVMINQLMGRSQDTEGEAVFSDVPADHWAYGYIQAAAK